MLIGQIILQDVTVGVWCAMVASSTIGPIFFSWAKKFTRIFYINFDTIFWPPRRLRENLCLFYARHFKEFSTLFSVYVCFGERITGRGLWSSRSLYLNRCDFSLWGPLNDKSIWLVIILVLKMIRREIFNFISRTSTWTAQELVRCDVRLRS